jgi:hypothetical protein
MKNKLNITKPNIRIEKMDIITVSVTLIFVGIIAGLIAYTYLELPYAILIAVVAGLLFGLLVNWARVNLLAGVSYPKPKTLIELTIYIIIAGTIVALISLGLDLIFVRIRDALL